MSRSIHLKCLASLLLLIASASFGQVVNGSIRDSITQAVLPYVHVGVPDKDMGTISHDDGSFQIDLSRADTLDSLTFSTIGYHTLRMSLPLQKQNPLSIQLIPRADTLREIRVEASRISNQVKLGRYQKTGITTGHSGAGDFGFGGEWGIRINHQGQTYRVADVQFHTRFNTFDSVLFRINIYRVQNGLPGKSLLSRPCLVKSYRRDQWIVKDVWSERMVIDQDVIVSYEVLQLWRNPTSDNALFFTHGKAYQLDQTYHRASSFAPWQIQKNTPVTLYLTVEGFQLTDQKRH